MKPELFPRKEEIEKLEKNQWYDVKGFYDGQRMYWEFKKVLSK